jgi:predicted TIM-barrel fold metal-dependent hydrolase
MPTFATDCHTHVFGPASAYPLSRSRVYTPGEASLDQLADLHRELGIGRVVTVQPSPYGTDNRCTLDAVRAANRDGADAARAVVVLDERADLPDLRTMHAAGARGVRLNFETHGIHDAERAREALIQTANRVAPSGWHVQLYTTPVMVANLAETIAKLPVPVVLDHFAGIRAEGGEDQPGFSTLLHLLSQGNTYIKLSAAQRASNAPDCADLGPLVRRLAAHRCDRLVWGSDWPHPGAWPGVKRDPAIVEPFHPIDDRRALARIAEWIPDRAQFDAVMVRNPAELYDWRHA